MDDSQSVECAQHALRVVSETPSRDAQPSQSRGGGSGSSTKDRASGKPAGGMPSLMVMPFIKLTPSADADMFADGLVEEITAALGRVRDFLVVARQSAYAYSGRSIDVREVGRELGVRYVVEGTVRGVGDRMRISVRLVDANSGVQIWSERYDDRFDNPFDLQDRIAAQVTGAVAAAIRSSEIAAAMSRSRDELTARDLVLRGLALFCRHDREDNEAALALFTRAAERDPHDAMAHAMRGWCLGRQIAFCWAEDPEPLRAAAEVSAARAAAIGGTTASVLVAASATFSLIDQSLDRASDLTDLALRIDPNCAWGWIRKGWLLVHSLEADQALAAFDRAAELSPFDPLTFDAKVGKAYALALRGDYAGAVMLCEQARRAAPEMTWPLLPISAFQMMLGDADKGRTTMQRYLSHNPNVTYKTVTGLPAPPAFVKAAEPFLKKLIEAGLPSG